MGYVHLVVKVNNIFWDRLCISPDVVEIATHHNTQEQIWVHGDSSKSAFETVDSNHVSSAQHDELPLMKRVKFPIILNGHELSYFAFLLRFSSVYRRSVVLFWCHCKLNHISTLKSVKLSISLIEPPKQIIDHSWNARITYLVSERSELDSAMSWFSTLGGAYSALGDHFVHCAKMAGRISLQQFKIALRLGDDNTLARCKLFIALSMIQTNRFKQAQKLIKEQYQLATNSSCPDIRLTRMCRGVWSKLQYERSRYKKRIFSKTR